MSETFTAQSGSPSGPAFLPPGLLSRLESSGPRYTSYPTADRFVEAHGPEQHTLALAQRARGVGGASGAGSPLSLYVHVPFCESLCYYCACNKIVTKHHERGAEYLDLLDAEIDLWVKGLGGHTAASQVHLGGGTPTFLSDSELTRLVNRLKQAFEWLPQVEASIEVDPRTVDAQRLAHLKALGFNRLSLGIQDFDERVQQAVHRVQSFEQVQALMNSARDLGFQSLNLDLICGLPLQTPESFGRTLQQVIALRPERIALYAYAHLPQRFKAQRRIHTADIPLPEVRLQLHAQAIAAFIEAGYEHIGMDHFALPDDALAQAKRQGRLHRNFQGYTVQPDGDLIGLGVSAISRLGATYCQNAKTIEEYGDALRQHQWPVVRGISLGRDDLVRRATIMALMCQGRLDFQALADAHLIDPKQYFAAELAALAAHQEQGLVELTAHAVEVTPLGWFFIRSIASVFDRFLQMDGAREKFSKII
ncbi:oxygen-independent coproporphyrinogen III oxidase [Inhella gelatinilytica]|uniref:Coproporphyrinogen-III oxidase n=1 Tax=Inhella gelatinilytica TaxID=2795030 RepID=A0A931NFC3_9BURK|nr:oxygen-independent coproporphyrinogen III oxidase [Inhella gelatinilytica]MBH9554105.1 oxygen-independent coproporphyrinogen III oxidase [Inhella gelatinilytica]